MKTTALPEIVGKTIKAVIISDRNRSGPETQVFIVFTDDTALELYGDIAIAGALDVGGEEHVQRYVSMFGGLVTRFPPDSAAQE